MITKGREPTSSHTTTKGHHLNHQ